jgi:hypothetical protein
MTTKANFPSWQLCLKPSLYGRFSLDHLWPLLGDHRGSFFNSHYDNACYLPMMGFVTFNDEAEQYLCAGAPSASVFSRQERRDLRAFLSCNFSQLKYSTGYGCWLTKHNLWGHCESLWRAAGRRYE